VCIFVYICMHLWLILWLRACVCDGTCVSVRVFVNRTLSSPRIRTRHHKPAYQRDTIWKGCQLPDSSVSSRWATVWDTLLVPIPPKIVLIVLFSDEVCPTCSIIPWNFPLVQMIYYQSNLMFTKNCFSGYLFQPIYHLIG